MTGPIEPIDLAAPITPDRLARLRRQLCAAAGRQAQAHHVAGITWQDVASLVATLEACRAALADHVEAVTPEGRADYTAAVEASQHSVELIDHLCLRANIQ